MHPAFGGFMNDPTAQMGVQLGQSAVAAGQQYMEQNVSVSNKEEGGVAGREMLRGSGENIERGHNR
jgi:hypothetical protein